MPSTYNNNLRIEIIATGEQSGTWGQTTNNNLGTLIVDAITGLTSVTTLTSPYPLTAINGAADESRAAALQLATNTGANFIVVVPTLTKLYVVKNVDPTYSVTVKTASGNGVVVPAGQTALLRCDGTNVVEQLDYVAGGFTVGGALTLGTDLSVANGGTGASSFTANNVLLGNGSSSFQTVAPGASGNLLISNGTTWTSSAAPPVNALGDPGANGVVVRTALNTTTARTITAGTGISITNGDGVAGNPTIANSGVTSVNGNTGAVTTLTSGTAVSASGTSVEFTSIPSTVKRITVLLRRVSTNGNSIMQIQIGSGGYTTSGYVGAASGLTSTVVSVNYSSGALLQNNNTSGMVVSGTVCIENISANNWIFNGVLGRSDGAGTFVTGGSLDLSGALDRVRLTTVNGTDTFDAGTVNIIYE